MLELDFTIKAIPDLAKGMVIAFNFTALSLTLSILLASLLTAMRALNIVAINVVLTAYVTYIRGTPLLVQIFVIYYLLPNVGLILPPYAAGLIAFVLNSAAIMHEVMRGGVTSIARGQYESAKAIGMSIASTWRYIVIPQVLIKITPQIINEFMILLKGTPLLAFISIVEVFRTAQLIYSSNYRPLEVLIGAALIFFIVNFVISQTGTLIERRLAKRC
jgi:His/Glu/Gln/Arg/opine family amino acid ABC transporter permease subunit